MSPRKVEDFWYWIPRILGLVAVLGLISKASVKVERLERKVTQVEINTWDLTLLKGVYHAVYPNVYDSVLDRQIKEIGPRPMEAR